MRQAGRNVGRVTILTLCLATMLGAQDNTSAAGGDSAGGGWATRSIALKYLDPDQLRQVFSGRSYVMQADRDLKLLTVTGPESFLREVEDTGKKLDIPPPLPSNLQITVYLLASAAQAPTAPALPQELQALGKTLAGSEPPMRLADSQILRVREGQAGELNVADTSGATTPVLSRVRIQAGYINTTTKDNLISLNGVRCWINRPTPGATPPAGPHGDGDVAASIDVLPSEATILASAASAKALVVAVRATVVR